MESSTGLSMPPCMRPTAKLSLNLPMRLSTELAAKRFLKTLESEEAEIQGLLSERIVLHRLRPGGPKRQGDGS